LPRTLRSAALVLYVAAVVLGALSLVGAAAVQLQVDRLPALFVLAVAVAIAQRVQVALPRGGDTSSTPLVLIATTLVLPPSEALVLSFAGVMLGQPWQRRPWYKCLFNAAQHALTVYVAAMVWLAGSGGGVTDPHELLSDLPWAFLAASAYYVVNGALTNLAIALESGRRVETVWWENHRNALFPRLGMYAMGIVTAAAWLFDWRAVPLLMMPAGLTWMSYRHTRALEEKTASEQRLREQTEALAERWETLARASSRLDERADPDSLLTIGGEILSNYCADAVELVAGERRARAHRDGVDPAIADRRLDATESTLADEARELPLQQGGSTIGTLRAVWIGRTPTAEELALLEPLAERVALVVHNALLVRQGVEVEALREVSRMKDEFLATVTHELRSPITLLMGYGELLTERLSSPDDVAAMGSRIYRAGEQLARLVDDLLDAGRLESGRFRLDRRPIDPLPTLRNAIEAAQAAHRDHTFALNSCSPLPPIPADPNRLQQILANLLGNAARYAPAGTAVTVEARQCDGELRVAVEDQGPGVPSAERERIFDRFYRTRDAERRTTKGLGLGLAICRDLVSAHGGRIWVEAASGGGARFVFTLPLAPSYEAIE
jgi:signal transduction histidine kinase